MLRSNILSRGLLEIDNNIARLEQENKELRNRIRELEKELCDQNVRFIAHSDKMMSNLVTTMVNSHKGTINE